MSQEPEQPQQPAEQKLLDVHVTQPQKDMLGLSFLNFSRNPAQPTIKSQFHPGGTGKPWKKDLFACFKDACMNLHIIPLEKLDFSTNFFSILKCNKW